MIKPSIISIVLLGVILLQKIKIGSSVTCRYYPNYPSISTFVTVSCTFYCCSTYPITSSTTCCGTTTRSTTRSTTTTRSTSTRSTTTYNYSDDSSWIIPVAIVGGFIGFCCLGGIVVGIVCAVSQGKRKPIINPNWNAVSTNPAIVRYPATAYPTTAYPVAQNATIFTTTAAASYTASAPYPNAIYSQLQPNPYAQFNAQPTYSKPNELVSNDTQLDEPPKYDSIINHPATISIDPLSSNQQMPTLPAPTIGFKV